MKPSTATADKRQRCVEMHKQRESYKIYQKNKTDDMPSTPRSSSHPTKRGWEQAMQRWRSAIAEIDALIKK